MRLNSFVYIPTNGHPYLRKSQILSLKWSQNPKKRENQLCADAHFTQFSLACGAVQSLWFCFEYSFVLKNRSD